MQLVCGMLLTAVNAHSVPFTVTFTFVELAFTSTFA